MPGHDDLFKDLIRHFFSDFVYLTLPGIAGLLVPEKAIFVDPEVFTAPPLSIRRQADVVARVPTRSGHPDAVLIHVEVESEARSTMEPRMFEYALMLRGRYHRRVVSTVLFLRGGPSAGPVPRTACEEFGPMTLLRLGYVAFSLSRSRAEDHLDRPQPLAWALAALMTTDLSPAAHRLRCVERIARADVTDHQRFLLYNCVRSYLELDASEQRRYEEMIAQPEKTDVAEMEMTWAERTMLEGHEKGLREGRLEGRREGRREGRLDGERRILRRLLEARFGPLSDRAHRRLDALDSTAEIERLVDRAVEADSLDDLLLNG